MTTKKSPKADLQRNKALFFEIGLATSLALAVAVFALGKHTSPQVSAPVPEPDPFSVELPPVTYQQAHKPVMPENVRVPADMVDVIEIIKNTSIIAVNVDPFDEFIPGDIYIPGVKGGGDRITDGDPVDSWFLPVEDMPQFEGGDLLKFRNWVGKRIQYPRMAAELNVQGQVVLTFVIERDGSLSNIEVLASPDKLLAQEAVRILEQSPKWKPGYQQDQAVRVKFTLPINFELR